LPQAGINVTFGAQGSTDSTGNITGYGWDFGDPASASNSATHVFDGHVFDQPGTYTVTLTITDDHGATQSTTTTVVVAAAPAIVPHITYTPANPTVGQVVTFSAAGSTDSTGTITNYVWSFPSGIGMKIGSSVNVTFSSTGFKLPVLTITDNHSQSGTNNVGVWVGP
jgi:PKD repeat protein